MSMTDIKKTLQNLRDRRFEVLYFENREQAADYLVQNISGTSVGVGGSVTINELDVYDRLKENNEIFWHMKDNSPDIEKKASGASIFLTSANAVAQSGEIINIDGRGNRVSAYLNNKEKVYIIFGINKIESDFDRALWRARNIASPKNAQRLGKNTPCAVKGDKCYECSSEQRICNGLVVLWGPMSGVGKMTVIVIGEELGL